MGLSLINNALFLAHKINEEKTALTLVDVLAKRYGKTVEVLLSLVTITSFIMLLAGNLVGMGFICSYVWGTSKVVGIWLSALIIWMYTVGGGWDYDPTSGAPNPVNYATTSNAGIRM